MITYVRFALADCLLAINIFDLWMSKGTQDFFDVAMNFIAND